MAGVGISKDGNYVQVDLDWKDIKAQGDPKIVYRALKELFKKQGKFIAEKPWAKCDRKGCYGRGYIGFDSKTFQPIPCKCSLDQLNGILYNKEEIKPKDDN